MAAEPRESQEQREERAAMKAHADATEREACQFWGYLLRDDKTGTEKLDRLLRGIAEVIVSPRQSNCIMRCWSRDS